MNQITVNGIKIDVVKKDIKNLHLAVYPPTGRVRIASPFRVNDEVIRLFVVSKLSWIKKQKRKFQEQERQTKREIVSRESHFYKGKRYLLNVVEENVPPRVTIRNKKILEVTLRPGSSLVQREKVLTEWYRKQLKEQIPPIIQKWEKKIGVSVQDWGVKQMKTKWGSCNISAKRIWINLELAKKPFQCLEYIIVHEMIHLLERHHNEKFIAYMDKFMPQWKQLKNELNKFPVSHSEWEY